MDLVQRTQLLATAIGTAFKTVFGTESFYAVFPFAFYCVGTNQAAYWCGCSGGTASCFGLYGKNRGKEQGFSDDRCAIANVGSRLDFKGNTSRKLSAFL